MGKGWGLCTTTLVQHHFAGPQDEGFAFHQWTRLGRGDATRNSVKGEKRSEGSYGGAPARPGQFLAGSVSCRGVAAPLLPTPSLPVLGWGRGRREGTGASGPSKARMMWRADREKAVYWEEKGKRTPVPSGVKRQGLPGDSERPCDLNPMVLLRSLMVQVDPTGSCFHSLSNIKIHWNETPVSHLKYNQR